MICAWNQLLGILPSWLRNTVDGQVREELQELRLRIGRPPELVTGGTGIFLQRAVTGEDIRYLINTASKYSPWSAGSTAQAYLTAPGGHRIGLCGRTAILDGGIHSLTDISSVNVRVARDFPGIAARLLPLESSLLILGRPGSGKTTLLRDLIRCLSNTGPSAVSVVDERGELFPVGCFDPGKRTDVLTGCPKAVGIDMVLRSMSPGFIAVDEITAEPDCEALIRAGWCGVHLLATAHAGSLRDLRCRPVYRSLLNAGLFSRGVILRPDKTWYVERMDG